MSTVLVFDELLGRARSLCIDCLDAWEQNGLDTPKAKDTAPTDLPCENCLEVERLERETS